LKGCVEDRDRFQWIGRVTGDDPVGDVWIARGTAAVRLLCSRTQTSTASEADTWPAVHAGFTNLGVRRSPPRGPGASVRQRDGRTIAFVA
jgi:hypothetical protein